MHYLSICFANCMFKKAGIILSIAFLCTAGLHSLINRPASMISSVEKKLNETISIDSALIAQWLMEADLHSNVLQKLNASKAAIRLFYGDSLVWWNDPATIKPEDDQSVWSTSFENNKYIVRYSMNPWESDGTLKKTLHNPVLTAYTLYKTDEATGTRIQLKDLSIPTVLQLTNKTDILASILFLTLIGLYFITGLTAYRDLKNHFEGFKSISFFVLIILSGRLIFELPSLKTLFAGIPISRLWSEGMAGFHSAEDLLLNFIAVAFILIGLTSRPLQQIVAKTPHSVLLFLTGLSLYGFFSFIVLLGRSFAYSTSVFAANHFLANSGLLNYLTVCLLIGYLLLLFHISMILFKIIHQSKNHSQSSSYIFLISGVLVAASFVWWMAPGSYQLYLVVFTVAYLLVMDAYTENAANKITYLLWWLILFSVFLTAVLYYFGIQKESSEREKFVQGYYAPPDQNIVQHLQKETEILLNNDIIQKLSGLEYPEKPDKNELLQFVQQFLQSDTLIDEIDCELFDKNGQSLFANHFAGLHRIQQTLQTSVKLSDFVFYNPFEKKYFIKIEIENEKHPNSPFLFTTEIFPKKNISDYKESSSQNTSFEYLIFYKNDPVLAHYKDGQRPDPAVALQAADNSIADGFRFFAYNPAPGIKVVSFRKLYGLIKPISLFSFILTLAGFIIIALAGINTKMDFLPENIALKLGSKSSLKTKIQAAIILLIIASFIIIGVVTAFYFKNLFEVNQLNRKKEDTAVILRNIQSSIQNLADEDSALAYLGQRVRDLAYVHQRDISIFDKNGVLYTTTERQNRLYRIPMHQLSGDDGGWHNAGTSVNRCCDDYEFNPIYFQSAVPFAFFGIKYPKDEVNSGNIFDFISTILNVYIFLFLLAGAIAITISNSITQPLTILANKLKEFKLGKSHDPLEWKSNDEIGELINDYNNLTNELQRSAEIIARTERDLAWREMAKQVAHEIKNPLTPMKLSIQYLERAAKERPEQAADLIPRVSATLIEQIDNLSQIASEFSNFATMPQASNEKIVLNEIVETIHDLFRKRDDMDISLVEPIDELIVFADKNHLIRILNNLVKNAIQAIPEDRRGKIEIELSQSGQNALIRVSDNGTGIPDHMKHKVFAPNFTTKSSGTGLGLAISANMIESFNGKLYFETQYGKGTDFYISIPLMRSEPVDDGLQRVMLD